MWPDASGQTSIIVRITEKWSRSGRDLLLFGRDLFAYTSIGFCSFYYRQGLAIDPAYLQNRVGEGKLMLVEEPYKAEEIFKEVLSGKNKKNVGLILAVARAYAENDPEKATEYLQRAKK